nr:hypothetical protein Iba_chr03cCG3140 [Ipomoea batatas]
MQSGTYSPPQTPGKTESKPGKTATSPGMSAAFGKRRRHRKDKPRPSPAAAASSAPFSLKKSMSLYLGEPKVVYMSSLSELIIRIKKNVQSLSGRNGVEIERSGDGRSEEMEKYVRDEEARKMQIWFSPQTAWGRRQRRLNDLRSSGVSSSGERAVSAVVSVRRRHGQRQVAPLAAALLERRQQRLNAVALWSERGWGSSADLFVTEMASPRADQMCFCLGRNKFFVCEEMARLII